jgi:hypothetical protein
MTKKSSRGWPYNSRLNLSPKTALDCEERHETAVDVLEALAVNHPVKTTAESWIERKRMAALVRKIRIDTLRAKKLDL